MRLDYLFKGLSGVAEGQVVQESLSHLVINVVPSPHYTPEDGEAIVQRIASRHGLRPEVRIEVRLLEKIPRERNGKFRPVISRVSHEPVLELVQS